jgi:hypothetical protein
MLLPALLGISNIIIDIYSNQIISFSILRFNNPSIVLDLLQVFQYVVFAVMLILYPIYPFFYSLKNYFSGRNPRSIITEYKVLKYIVISLFPLFIFAILLITATRIANQNPLTSIVQSLPDPTIASLFITTMGVIFFVVGSALLRIILMSLDKGFRFYFARVSFMVMLQEQDDVTKMKYLIIGLNSYNKFIKRNLGLQIVNLRSIYSRIISDVSIDTEQLMNEVVMTFKDNDRLGLIRYLTAFLKITDSDQFLKKESIGNKIGNWAETLLKLASIFAAISGALITLKII